MNRILLLHILLTVSLSSVGQQVRLYGTVHDICLNDICPNAIVYIDSIHGTVCDEDGKFELYIDTISPVDTIYVRSFGLRDLKITGISMESEKIDLGRLPMICRFEEYEWVEFFCKTNDLKCLEEQEKYLLDLRSRQKNQILEINQKFAEYRYLFRGSLYKPRLNEDNYNLVTIIDVSSILSHD